MNTKHYIEIPADKVEDAVRAAYDLSLPVGMGILHARTGPLDEATVKEIVESKRGIHMDYVHGRQCKFGIYKDGDGFYISPRWFDHSDNQLVELLTVIGIDDPRGKIDAAIAAGSK